MNHIWIVFRCSNWSCMFVPIYRSMFPSNGLLDPHLIPHSWLSLCGYNNKPILMSKSIEQPLFPWYSKAVYHLCNVKPPLLTTMYIPLPFALSVVFLLKKIKKKSYDDTSKFLHFSLNRTNILFTTLSAIDYQSLLEKCTNIYECL